MTVIFRLITNQDIDQLFSLNEVDKFKEYLYCFDYAREAFIDRGQSIAKDDVTGNYLVRLPQGDRLDNFKRYVLVSEGKLIISKAMFSVLAFDVEYVSPALISRLDELTPFMREAFANGGDYLSDEFPSDLERAVGAQMNFVLSNKQ